MESPFDVLGLAPDADEREIVRAYRDRIKQAHPDHGGSAAEFRRVRGAYERLRDTDDPSELVGEPVDGRGATGDRAHEDAGANDTHAAEPEPQPEVEFLNYEVLADHGWELTDDDLFEKAAAADLDPDDYGRFLHDDSGPLLEAAEEQGFVWPYACRGGACTNCAVAIVEGEMPEPTGHILPDEWIDQGIRLSCLSCPTTDEAKVVYNVKHMPGLDELRLPASRFKQAQATD